MGVEFVRPLLPPKFFLRTCLEVPSDSESKKHHPRKAQKTKKHSDKCRHKSHRHVTSSSEESNLPSHPPKKIFIVLIHPIQFTIALPFSATGPAKHQKKMAGPVTECAFARWHIVLPSCLDSVMS